MANPPPSEPSLPELPEIPEAAASEPETPYEEERDSTPPDPPAPDRKLTPADERRRALSCAILMGPKLARVIRAIVIEIGVKGSKVDDLVNEVRGRIWMEFDLKGDWPQEEGRWVAIVRKVTKSKVIDIFRHESTRAQFNAKLAPEDLEKEAVSPGSHRDQDDVREKASLVDQVDMPREVRAVIVDAMVAKKSVSAAGRELGMTGKQALQHKASLVSSFMKLYEHRFGKAALTAAALGGGAWMVAAFIGHRSVEPFLWYEGGGTTVTVQTADAPNIRQDAGKLALDAYEAARDAFQNDRLGDCRKALDLAQKYDKDENLKGMIDFLRERVGEDEVLGPGFLNAKPGQTPAPPKGK